jgi:poly(A) polymerase
MTFAQDLSAPLSIVTQLRERGFQALFAGGWVRDYLLGKRGVDVDIATDATPQEIAEIFEKTVPVGANFGVMIVVVEGTPYEVATFRRDGNYVDGRHPVTVEFSEACEDAQRRDFTINGMFYDPIENKVIDYVHGQEDLSKKILRAIGNPEARFREDHLRMLRAVRFATRLGFALDPATAAAIQKHADLIAEGVSAERIAQELGKIAQDGNFLDAMQLMSRLGLLQVLFPDAASIPEQMDSDLPLILQLCSLFRDRPGPTWIGLAERLKLSGEERRMAETLTQAHEILSDPEMDAVRWAHFLARPWAEECLEALFCWGGGYPHDQRAVEELIEDLADAVNRIILRQPVVNAGHLLAKGIPPGPELGHWLKEAERVAIEQRLESADDVLEQLPRFRS